MKNILADNLHCLKKNISGGELKLLLIFTLLGLVMPYSWVAAAPTRLWDRTFNGSGNGNDDAMDIVADKNTPANVYVTGNSTTLTAPNNMATKNGPYKQKHRLTAGLCALHTKDKHH